MAGTRRARVDEEIKRAISEIIASDVKDDRLSPMVSVTGAEVTTDLKHAKIYISVYGTDKERRRTFEALEHAAGFIRSRLAKKISLRRAPELVFEADNSVENGLHIAKLLSEVRPPEDEEGSGENPVTGGEEEDHADGE